MDLAEYGQWLRERLYGLHWKVQKTSSRRSARRLDVAGRIKTLRVVVQRLQSYQDGTMQNVSISED